MMPRLSKSWKALLAVRLCLGGCTKLSLLDTLSSASICTCCTRCFTDFFKVSSSLLPDLWQHEPHHHVCTCDTATRCQLTKTLMSPHTHTFVSICLGLLMVVQTLVWICSRSFTLSVWIRSWSFMCPFGSGYGRSHVRVDPFKVDPFGSVQINIKKENSFSHCVWIRSWLFTIVSLHGQLHLDAFSPLGTHRGVAKFAASTTL